MSKRRRGFLSDAAVINAGSWRCSAVAGTFYFIPATSTAVSRRRPRDQQSPRRGRASPVSSSLIEIRKEEEPVLHRETIPKTMPAAKLIPWPCSPTTRAPTSWSTYRSRCGCFGWRVEQVLVHERHGIASTVDRVHITLEDVERRARGLLLDQADRRGSQVLIWTE